MDKTNPIQMYGVKLLRDIFSEELPIPLYNLINDCGFDLALKLIIQFPGIQIYIPKTLNTTKIMGQLKNEYNGNNLLSLAVKYKLDSTDVKKLLKKKEYKIKDNIHINLVNELCGENAASVLIEKMPGQTLYISEKWLKMLQRLYIEKNYYRENHTRLAVCLGVSERYIKKVIANYHSHQISQRRITQ